MKKITTETPAIDTVLVQTYYTTEGDKVFVNRKIGDGKWEKILTEFDRVPYVIHTWKSKEELLLNQGED